LVLFAYIGQITVTRALYLIPAAKCNPFQYVGVIIGFISDIYFFNKRFDVYTIIGMIITSSGLIYLTFKWKHIKK
jgi:drug/metabolite transporter (DMT)-like permease